VMHLYDLDLNEVEKSVLWSLTVENELKIDKFYAECHELFKEKHNDVTMELTNKTKKDTKQKSTEKREPKTKEKHKAERIKKKNNVNIEQTNKPQIETKQKSSERSEPKTKEDHLAEGLETMSPKDLLEDLSSGGHASESDMKLIREVMLKQGLKTPVMNVLIH